MTLELVSVTHLAAGQAYTVGDLVNDPPAVGDALTVERLDAGPVGVTIFFRGGRRLTLQGCPLELRFAEREEPVPEPDVQEKARSPKRSGRR